MKQKRGQSIPLLREPESQPARPLYVQLYRRVREGVLRGTIAPGTRLPSARTLASEEGISRNTVEAAFRQLQAEGFVERRVGAGTWVTEDLPERLLGRRDGRTRRAPASAGSLVKLSERGRELVGNGSRSSEPSDLIFAPCLPAAEAIPAESWNRIAARHLRRSKGSLDAPPPAGLPALREAVAEYLHLNRGVRCTADRVVILNSTQQAMNLAARLLLDPGDVVWLEDPGYLSARRAFRGARAKVHPVAVDDRGMDVAGAVKNAPDARLVYVTPSHQYPM
ncbi:MAG: PLP-dependent aminotransferase family protein, partial [Gemmatimonadota bacterium]